MSRLTQPARVVNGRTTTNAQPPLLLVAGLSLPRSDELPDKPLEGGATPEGGAAPDGSPESPLAAGAGLAGGGG